MHGGADIQLRRVIRKPTLVFYGVGTMVGAGFYALLGEIAGTAGMQAPLAFLAAGILAGLSGLSFAELASRYPVSAGESAYVHAAWARARVSGIVGLLVAITGIVSSATLAVATARFVQDLIDVPSAVTAAAVILVIGGIAAWGVGQSVGVVVAITVIEVGAVVLATAAAVMTRDLASPTALVSGIDAGAVEAIFIAGFLAFYAFIGFEDMVNMAEEVVEPRRTLPHAIIIAVAITTTIYVVASSVAVLAVPINELADARTPLATLVENTGFASITMITAISILAGINGALVQIVMASRVAYGMARLGRAPAVLGRVHPRTHTPVIATVLAAGCALVLATIFPLATLATWTSMIVLVVFAIVNAALVVIKRQPDPAAERFHVPIWVPVLGTVVSSAAVVWRISQIVTGEV